MCLKKIQQYRLEKKENNNTIAIVKNINILQYNAQDVSEEKSTDISTAEVQESDSEFHDTYENDWEQSNYHQSQNFDSDPSFSREMHRQRRIFFLKIAGCITGIVVITALITLLATGTLGAFYKGSKSTKSATPESYAAGVGVQKAIAENTTYVINKESGKIHIPTCSAVMKMSYDNMEQTDIENIETLEQEGYEPCLQCLGNDDK